MKEWQRKMEDAERWTRFAAAARTSQWLETAECSRWSGLLRGRRRFSGIHRPRALAGRYWVLRAARDGCAAREVRGTGHSADPQRCRRVEQVVEQQRETRPLSTCLPPLFAQVGKVRYPKYLGFTLRSLSTVHCWLLMYRGGAVGDSKPEAWQLNWAL